MDLEARRAQLLGWIDDTRRLQRRMALAFCALGIVAVGLMFWRSGIGTLAAVSVALTALCSFWITAAHNASHRQKLDEIASLQRNHGKPLQTAHRRWHS